LKIFHVKLLPSYEDDEKMWGEGNIRMNAYDSGFRILRTLRFRTGCEKGKHERHEETFAELSSHKYKHLCQHSGLMKLGVVGNISVIK
jgi:hypothetical protein